MGIHTRIAKCDETGIRSHGGNRFVPVWNHDIMPEVIDDTRARYTDQVEIHVGRKTVFVYYRAKAFCTRRQRKRIRILEEQC